MSSDKKYMNGQGVIEHTDELNRKAWDTMLGAWIGLSVVFCGPLIAWKVFYHTFSWEPPPNEADFWIATAASVVCVVGGIIASVPYFRAMRALRRHTKAMKAETEKRGKGWAKS
jgi:membrane associated rhomboid family serine protease